MNNHSEKEIKSDNEWEKNINNFISHRKSINITEKRDKLFSDGILLEYEKLKSHNSDNNPSFMPTEEEITKCYNYMIALNEPIITSYNFGLKSKFIVIDADPYYFLNPNIAFYSDNKISMLERDVSLRNFIVKNKSYSCKMAKNNYNLGKRRNE